MRCAANQPFLREAHIEQKSPRPRPPGQCLTTRDCPYLAQCTELSGITGSATTPQCPLSIRVPRLVTDVASSKQPRLRSDKPLPPTRRAAAIGAGCPVLCCAVLCCAVLCRQAMHHCRRCCARLLAPNCEQCAQDQPSPVSQRSSRRAVCSLLQRHPIGRGAIVHRSAEFIPLYPLKPMQVRLSWCTLVECLRLTISPTPHLH